jgi:hypothetical protein
MLETTPAIALDFDSLLTEAGYDPAFVVIQRHAPKNPALLEAFPTIITEHRDLLMAYQMTQWPPGEGMMAKATAVAAFFGGQGGETIFAGLFRIKGCTPTPYAKVWEHPGNLRLADLGMQKTRPDDEQVLLFDLEPDDQFAGYVGRLGIGWKPGQAWSRWAGRSAFPILTITDENRFLDPMPSWDMLNLSWSRLHHLPTSWRLRLEQWRGVYYIFDVARRVGYVGSAYGAQNLLGRWLNYARTGDGNNVRLKDSRPEDLRFSILQLTAQDLDIEAVVALEGSWKQRLWTREFGLNAN